MTREKYESLPLATLKELAKARKMRGVSTLKKGDLIDAMLQLDDQEEQKEAAEDRRGGADPPEQPEIAQDGGLLVLVHSAGRHLSRLH